MADMKIYVCKDCGETFSARHVALRCERCAKKAGRRRKETPRKEGIRTTEARCPMCGVTHSVRMEWTGRGHPQVYCSRCRQYKDQIGTWVMRPYDLLPTVDDK